MNVFFKGLVLASVVSAAGCGGGGGGGSVQDDDRNLPEARPQSTVSGIAFDGLIIDGDVRVYDFTGANKGELLGTAKTNGQGLYSVSLSTSSKPILVEIDGGYYLEEASGVQVQVDRSRGRRMLAVEYYESGRPIDLSATFFSTIATGLVEYMVKEQGISAEVAIERAYADVDAWAGFDTRGTTPLDVSSASSATPYLTDAHRYGFVAAGISQLSREVGAATGDGVHDLYTSISFIQTAYGDVKTDGILDGFGEAGRINFGSIAVNSNTYRDFLAMRMLQFVRSARNQTGLEFSDVLPFASQVNVYAGDIFDNVAAPDITESHPTITQMTPANGTVVNGTYPVSVIATDDYGIANIDVYVGDQFVVAAALSDQRASIDTRNFVNGSYVLRVDVTNFMGNTVSATRNITINNGQLSLVGSGEHRVGWSTSDTVTCNAAFTISDTTGLGVEFAKIGETVVLLETAGSASFGRTERFTPDLGTECVNRTVVAEDRIGGRYEFPLRIGTYHTGTRFRDGKIEFEHRCHWQAGAHC